MAKTLGITQKGGKPGNGKYVLGSSKDESVRGQAKGAAKSFAPKSGAMPTKSGPDTAIGTQNGKAGKTYTPPPQQGGRADKVAGTSSAAGANRGLSFGAGKKLGNHYSNS